MPYSIPQNLYSTGNILIIIEKILMHQSIETPTLPPPGQRWGFDIDCCQKLSNAPPLGPNFLSKWIKMRQTPQGLGTQIKKRKIAKILAKQIPISKQALLALFILA